jgi:hypothetical protein
LSRLKSSLPEPLAAAVKTAIEEWQSSGKMQRLWSHDATLWTGKIANHPNLHSLDSTGPAQVRAFENKIDMSGSTTMAAAV